jgi:hypothetical protein
MGEQLCDLFAMDTAGLVVIGSDGKNSGRVLAAKIA